MNAYYKVDVKRKFIIIDDTIKSTAAEEKDIDRYVAAGYIIKHKSQARAKKAIERASKDNLTNEIIMKNLANDEEAKKKYEEIKKGKGKGKGFFAAKKWYLEYKAK